MIIILFIVTDPPTRFPSQTHSPSMGPITATYLHRNSHRGHQGVRPAGCRILRSTPKLHTRHESHLSAEPRPSGVAVRRQFAPSVGGQQKLFGRSEIPSARREVEENIDYVLGICRETFVTRH